MTAVPKVSKQIAYKRKRIARGDKLVCVWMDAETDALWKVIHPRHGGTEATLALALIALDCADRGKLRPA